MSTWWQHRGCEYRRSCLHVPRLSSHQVRAILDRVIVDDSEQCWSWRYVRTATTYTISGVGLFAPYRLVWAIVTGEDVCPKLRVIHHHCMNRWCVNPAHLQSMTYSEHGRLHYELRQAA